MLKDPLYPELDEEPTPEDEALPTDVQAEDWESTEDDYPPGADDGLDVRTAPIPDDAI
jgi:hypothetical protein